jgi:hypothetical protein
MLRMPYAHQDLGLGAARLAPDDQACGMARPHGALAGLARRATALLRAAGIVGAAVGLARGLCRVSQD